MEHCLLLLKEVIKEEKTCKQPDIDSADLLFGRGVPNRHASQVLWLQSMCQSIQMTDMLQCHIFAKRDACVELGESCFEERVATVCQMAFSPVTREAAIAGEHDISKA